MTSRFSRHFLIGLLFLGSLAMANAATDFVATPQIAMPATPCNEVTGMAGPYPCKKVDLLYFMPLADVGCGSAAVVWGWTDPTTQKEYALLACNNGIVFVDITLPTAPLYLGRLPARANSLWRDVKVDGNYAFVGSEAPNHGIQVFDLTRLRNVPSPPVTFTDDAYYAPLGRSHTLAINEQKNMLYAAGSQSTCGGDLHQIDISDPLNPTFAGCLSINGYVHEAQCVRYTGPDTQHQGKDICFNSDGRFDNTDTLAIDDVTNPSAPVQLWRDDYPNVGYTHQSCITEDQQYLLLDDEFDEQDFGYNSRTLIWNISDLDNPVFMGAFLGTTTAVDHNQYIRGSFAYQSNYRAGLRILDLRNIAAGPGNLSEYGYFDIYPDNDLPNYNAAWGNYPYFPSGTVVVSGIEQGLFILNPIMLPKLSINDVSITEGNSGNRNITFTVTLSAPSEHTVIVNYATANGTATAPQDYIASSGSIVIPAGSTTRSKPIGVVGDTVLEPNETFFLDLTTATNAEIEDARGIATIIDNDLPVPTITMNDVAINEGDSGTSTAAVTLTLSPTSSQTVTVDWVTEDASATSPEDYTAASGTVTFAPGASSATAGPIHVHGDLTIEANEIFLVNFSNPSGGAALGDTLAQVTLINDDILSVSAVSPTSGPSSGGTEVTLTGTRFSEGVAVHFGDSEATDIVVISDSQLTAKTPAMPAGALVGIHAHLGGHGPVGPPLHPPSVTFLSDFLDVSGTHPFHNFIEKIFRNGITAGCNPGNYCPADSVSRAQMAVFLLRSKYGSTYAPPPATGIFEDVPIDHPFAGFIEQLYNEGITSGCSADPLRYCPADPVSRGQMSVFLLKTREGSDYQPPAPTGIFEDVPPSHPFAAWIEQIYNEQITAGCSTTPLRYCPNDPNTRGQMAVFLVRTFDLP